MVEVMEVVLVVMRLILLGLALGLTIISFQAYRRRRTERLEYAFIGFAFISMGVALASLATQVPRSILTVYGIVQTIPFIIGFAMLYLSLYR